jgi:predicted phosphodiesterase
MRVAALYDIHGNLPALDAVLKDVAGADVEEIIIGGDVVPGPMPRETLARLLEIGTPIQFIHGNGELGVLAVREGRDPGVPEQVRPSLEWNAQQIEPHQWEAMERWPATLRVDVSGFGDVLFCHATPRNATEIFIVSTAEKQLLPIFDAVGASLVVCGHTHMQFDRRIGRTRVVNAGSVGMPIGEPGAHWLLIGTDIELRRTPYDVAEAAATIRKTDFPAAAFFADQHVSKVPSTAGMLAFYSRSELRS